MFHDLKISKKFFLGYRSRLKNFGKHISEIRIVLQLLLYGHIEPERASKTAKKIKYSEIKLKFDRHFNFLCQIGLCKILEPKNDYHLAALYLQDSIAFKLVQVDHNDLLNAFENFEPVIFDTFEIEKSAIGQILDGLQNGGEKLYEKLMEIALAIDTLDPSDLKVIATASGNYLKKYCNAGIIKDSAETLDDTTKIHRTDNIEKEIDLFDHEHEGTSQTDVAISDLGHFTLEELRESSSSTSNTKDFTDKLLLDTNFTETLTFTDCSLEQFILKGFYYALQFIIVFMNLYFCCMLYDRGKYFTIWKDLLIETYHPWEDANSGYKRTFEVN